jgi:hypothetical protein
MTTQQIINKFVTQDSPEHLASNILMGIYLGMEYVDDDPEFSINGYFTDNSIDDISWIDSDLPENWQFHCNWNWLVPIVQKLLKEVRENSCLEYRAYKILETRLKVLDYDLIYNYCTVCIESILNSKDESNL